MDARRSCGEFLSRAHHCRLVPMWLKGQNMQADKISILAESIREIMIRRDEAKEYSHEGIN